VGTITFKFLKGMACLKYFRFTTAVAAVVGDVVAESCSDGSGEL